jgi:hypothetical protein
VAVPNPKLAAGASPLPGMGDPGAAVGGAGAGGPTPSPMATPQPMEGMQKGARIQVQIAAEMLQRELPNFDLKSDEFDAVSKALQTLKKAFGEHEDSDRKLFPSEIMNMVGAIGPGAMSPGQKAVAGAPAAAPA